ncbi:MAG: VOC family protein [Pyrinomonadaceae bacterium]
MKNVFHLAFPVDNIEKARRFYVDVLGCTEGRSSDRWVDFDLFGHQIVAHKTENARSDAGSNSVDSDDVPVPHFGIVLEMDDWKALRERLESAGVEFVISPKVRFRGTAGEQATMFFRDPSGNALEFKGFNDFSKLFATD